MADNHRTAESSDSGTSDAAAAAAGESSDSVIQLNVKTLDSRIYSFHVDKNMSVSAFKERIAGEVSLPVAQQRLIFRGKVLKDEDILSEYHVENGHTLHLVERQATQPQTSAGTASAEINTNNGNDGNPGVHRNRVGQISHSVVLGTFNVGEQSETGLPDLNRVIGAVLNSFGLGGQPTTTGTSNTQSSAFSNGSGQVPQGGGLQGAHVNAAHNQTGGSTTQSRNSFFSQQFPSTIPGMRTPPVAEGPPIPSLFTPVPDSLNTMFEFMNHMEHALSDTGVSASQTNTPPPPTPGVPSNARGLPTPEALSIALRHAQRLLIDHAIPAISNLAGNLEQNGASTDVTSLGQVHARTMQLGVAVQQLGALFLELGRTLLTLRMGGSPAELLVNAGPAVYISSNRPNPIMVQPFPLQTSPVFDASIFPANGAGSIPRSVNIHIHAGLGARTGNGEGLQATNTGSNSSGDSGPTRPATNVSDAATPTNPTAVAQPGVDVSISPSPSAPDSISAMLAEMSSRIRTSAEETRAESQTAEVNPRLGEARSSIQDSSIAAETGIGVTSNQNMSASEALGKEDSTCSSVGETSVKLPDDSDAGSHEKLGKSEATQAVPLGLGLGGLQPKSRSGQPKLPCGGGASTSDSNREVRTSGQQLLQSLASRSSVPSGSDTNRGQSPNLQMDPANIMSQVIQSPALNGLLAGVSNQTGVGSPDMLRNMLGQMTQNPMMRNVVNQIAQQVDTGEMENMLSGMGGGQGSGGFDLSRMLQQMMPIVSQALSGGSTIQQPFPAAETVPQPQYNDRMPSRDTPQIGLQPAAQRIAHQAPPSDVFRAVVENAASEYGDGDEVSYLIEELPSDEALVHAFMEMLVREALNKLGEQL